METSSGVVAAVTCPVCHCERADALNPETVATTLLVADDHDPAECAELIDEAKRLELDRLFWEVL